MVTLSQPQPELDKWADSRGGGPSESEDSEWRLGSTKE